MARADPLFKLRLPDRLREALEEAAEDNRRSLTAEILGRLEASLSETTQRLKNMEEIVFDDELGNESLAKRVFGLESLLVESLQGQDDPASENNVIALMEALRRSIAGTASKAAGPPPALPVNAPPGAGKTGRALGAVRRGKKINEIS